jgi:DNA-binding transcriptional LysR family regulator
MCAPAITFRYPSRAFDRVNLRQLQYWLAVVDTASFTRAAERLHVSQPGLSQQIRALEAELGGRLLERLPRGIRLTAAGKAFLPEARAAVRAAERAENAARGALALRTAELEIATLRSIAVGLLPSAIRRLLERHPGIVVDLHEYRHRLELEKDVRSGVADVAVGPPPLEFSAHVEHLGWEHFVAVVGARDPIAEQPRATPVPLEGLRDRRWILFPSAHGLSDLIAAACARAGFIPQGTVVTEQVEAAARLAAAGVGVALVPENIVPSELAGNVRRLARPVIRELTAYTRTEWSPPALALLEALRAERWSGRPEDAEVIA